MPPGCPAAPKRKRLQVGTEQECEAALQAAAELPDKTVLIECMLDPADCSGACVWVGVGERGGDGLWRAVFSSRSCCPAAGWGWISGCCGAATPLPLLLCLPAVEVLTLGKLMSQVGGWVGGC